MASNKDAEPDTATTAYNGSATGTGSVKTNDAVEASPQLTNTLRIGKPRGYLMQRLFPPGRKATGVRRYLCSLSFLIAVDAVLWAIFTGVYSTSVRPVLLLDDPNSYDAQVCEVVAQRMDRNVIGFYTTAWRGEITARFNTSNGKQRLTQVHDSVTGIYGRLSVSLQFLDSFPVGRKFECLVMKTNSYFAAVAPEEVLPNAILGLSIICVVAVATAYAIVRTWRSFLTFRRDFIWSSDLQAWVVKRREGTTFP